MPALIHGLPRYVTYRTPAEEHQSNREHRRNGLVHFEISSSLAVATHRLRLCLLLVLANKGLSLLLDTLLSSFASGLGLGTLGVHLLSELGLAECLSLGLVDL